MRYMVKFTIPIDQGNELVKSGKISGNFQSLMEDFKPEAAYFFPDEGQRSGFMIINVTESPDFIKVAESFWLGLHAAISIIPVVSGEELAKGIAGIAGIVKRYT